MKIGVLDIQGSVEEHSKSLEQLDCEVVLVKKVGDLEGLSGLILPGGESTTLEKLMRRFGLWEAIVARFKAGDLAVFGTCAGCILLEKMGLMNVKVARNAYGRQVDSFETSLNLEGVGEGVPAVFIRAPKIVEVGEGVEVLGSLEGDIVACREGRALALTFHPEMSDDLRVHRYFLEMCRD